MDLNLAGRTAVVTGASKGIGRAVAERLAAEGVRLHLVARSSDDLEIAAAEIRKRHRVDVAVWPLDLSDGANVDRLFAAAPDVDILVNNAGAIPRGTIEEIEEEAWRAAWDLKVFGYINMCRAFYAAMAKRGRGVIINVIGTGGEKPDAGFWSWGRFPRGPLRAPLNWEPSCPSLTSPATRGSRP